MSPTTPGPAAKLPPGACAVPVGAPAQPLLTSWTRAVSDWRAEGVSSARSTKRGFSTCARYALTSKPAPSPANANEPAQELDATRLSSSNRPDAVPAFAAEMAAFAGWFGFTRTATRGKTSSYESRSSVAPSFTRVVTDPVTLTSYR